jgi:hypothetical protein
MDYLVNYVKTTSATSAVAVNAAPANARGARPRHREGAKLRTLRRVLHQPLAIGHPQVSASLQTSNFFDKIVKIMLSLEVVDQQLDARKVVG